MGNICRAINAGFKDIDSFLDAFLEPVKSLHPDTHHMQAKVVQKHDTTLTIPTIVT